MKKLAQQTPLNIPKPGSINPNAKIGVSGTAVYGGFVTSVEKNPQLYGNQRYQTYSELFSNISIVAAGVRYFLNVITKSAWKLEPPDDSSQAREKADLVEEMMHDMEIPWHRIIRKAVMFKFYGFGIQEWTAKLRPDGVIGLLSIESRPQRTIEQWDVDQDGVVKGVVQRSPQTGKSLYIPRAKSIYLVDDSLNDSPEGFGLFRHVVSPSKRLERYEQLEGYGYETDLRGIPVARAPIQALAKKVEDGEITKEDYVKIMAPLTSFVTNHVKGPKLGLLLDSMTYSSTNEATTPSPVKEWDIELLKGGSESLREMNTSITRVTHDIARILGAEGLMLGGTGRGSQALSRDKSDNFYMVVDSALNELAACFTKDVIDPIWMLNGWDMKLKPKFKTDSLQLRDIEQITTSLFQMAQAGAILAPDDPAIAEVRDLLGLSRPSDASSSLDVAFLGNPRMKPNAPAKPAASAVPPTAPKKPGGN